MKFFLRLWCCTFALCGTLFCIPQLWAQDEGNLRDIFRGIGEQIAGGLPLDSVSEESGDAAVQDDGAPIELPRSVIKVKPNEIRLHLNDGSVVTGELAISELLVTTEFGPLTVPVSRVKSVRPGLKSYPVLLEKLGQLVQQLGDEAYEKREQAQKELMGYGLSIKNYLSTVEDEGDSELKRRLETIQKGLEELQDLEDDSDVDPPWIFGDTVVTDDFTIVGKIQSDEFALASKYGDLKIQLADVKFGTRQWGTRDAISRNLTMNAQNFVQRTPASTKIRVQRGDELSIKVDGTLYLGPWDETTTPDGLADYGTYMGKFPIGAVLVRVGKGDWQLVGREQTLTAPRDGTVELSIAMMDNFINNGYEFPGEYKVRLKFEPR